MNDAKLYLCKADCSILGAIGGLKVETCNLTRNALDLWEITFEVDRFIDKDGKLVQSDYYDSIDEMMRIYLDSETIQAFFVIDSEPIVHGEDLQEVKTVTAHSIECELGNMPLKNLKINCGTYDSQEYLIEFSKPKLVLDKDGNPMLDRDGNKVYTDNNLNPYTGLPYEYISLVNYEYPELSLMHMVLDGTGWTLEDNIPSEICNIKKSYDTSESIYAFLMKQVSPASDVIFEFDRKHKKINIISINEYGKDTGVFVTMRNLMNSFEVTSSSEDSIITKLIPTGANDLGILYVNFGEDYIVNLDYFMNTLNEYGDYKYVSKELRDKYIAWKNCRDFEKVTYPENDGKEYSSRRELYTELSRKYNKTILDISELHNRLPNDGCIIDYKTFSLEELKTSLTAYENALNSLITAYKDEFGVTEIGTAPNYSPTPSNATNIKDTPYWYDFYAYQEKIIPQVKESLKMYCKTDSDGYFIFDLNGDFIELEQGNREYYENTSIVKDIDGYLYEWSLYGLDELESKKKAWNEVSSVLNKDYYVKTRDDDGNIIEYITVGDWKNLTDKQKLDFTSEDAFISSLNAFLDYMSFDERENSLTGTVCKGIIRQCEEAILERNNSIKEIESLQKKLSEDQKGLLEEVAMNKFFTTEELFIIKGMLKEQEYNNENILVTNLNNIAKDENKPYQDEIDIQEELYQASLKELDKLSQPQYSFSTELDNLYSLEEFKSYRKPFDVGNFIRVGLSINESLCSNEYIKLRLISISNNPMMISDNLSVEFSTMTKTLNTISDLSFLLDKELSSGSSTSSSSSGSGGTYGNNDANVQMSNNMLNALLSTETFGTYVNDVILDSIKANKGNFNVLFAHSGAFDSLEAGKIKVSGDCLFDKIKSSNWNGTDDDLLSNTEGSVIDLYDGKFNFAGGKLNWDGSILSIDGNGSFSGEIFAKKLTLGNDAKINTTNIIGLSNIATSGDYNDLSNAPSIPSSLSDLVDGANVMHFSDITFGTPTTSNGITTQTITYKDSSGNSYDYTNKYSADGSYLLTNVGKGTGSWSSSTDINNHKNNYFLVSTDGLLKANNAIIYGDIYASNGRFSGDVIANTLTANVRGSIAGWQFNEKAFFKNDIDILGSKENFYIGEDGISIGDYFIVDENGMKSQNANMMNDVYDSSISIYPSPTMTNTDMLYITLPRLEIGDYVGFSVDVMYFFGSIDDNTNGSVLTQNTYSFIVDNNNVLNDSITSTYNVETKEVIICIPSKTILSYSAKNEYGSRYKPNELRSIQVYNEYNSQKRELKKVTLTNYNEEIIKEFNGDLLYKNYGLIIDTANKNISGDRFELTTTEFNSYGEFSFNIYNDYNDLSSSSSTLVRLNSSEFYHTGLTTSSSGNSVSILDGQFYQKSSSSKRYKNSIKSINSKSLLSELSPHNLYDINVVVFKYNEDYLTKNDQRYNKDIIGFIAEDIYQKYPIACNLNQNGEPEMWDINIMFPAALKLIQEQHQEIELLKEEINKLKNNGVS